jgi:glucan biosynthesis protein C
VNSSFVDRYHGLDALRGFAMLLGIVLHGALPYMGLPNEVWPSDKGSSPITNIIFEFIHIWRMPVFFVLAGFFASLVIDRYSWSYWWDNRLKRILLPVIIFTPILALTVPWIWIYGLYGKLSFFYTMEGSPWHLWFLYHLMLFAFFSFICVSLGEILRNKGLGIAVNYLSYLNIFGWVTKYRIFQSRYPVMLTLLILLTGWSTAAELPENPIASALYFSFGYGLYKKTSLLNFMKRHWIKYMVASIFFFVLYLLTYKNLDYLDPTTWETWYIPYIGLKSINGVLFSYALIGFAEEKFGDYSSVLRFISDSSYWIYLIHFPLITLITFSMFNITLFLELKFIIAIIVTSLIGLISYKYMVRSTLIGVLLNGKKLP